MSASSPLANTEQPQTIKTWSSNTLIENARTKPNFSAYVLSKSSSKTIVALHPIPLKFLLKLTHEERVELANKTDVDIRSAKPGLRKRLYHLCWKIRSSRYAGWVSIRRQRGVRQVVSLVRPHQLIPRRLAKTEPPLSAHWLPSRG